MGLLLTVGRAGPLWACSAVGFAFGLHAMGSMLVVQVTDGINVTEFVRRSAPALLACVPLVLAVLAARQAMAHVAWSPRGGHLVVEIVAGAAAYLAAAPIIARETTQDVLGLVRLAWAHRTSDATPSSGELHGG